MFHLVPVLSVCDLIIGLLLRIVNDFSFPLNIDNIGGGIIKVDFDCGFQKRRTVTMRDFGVLAGADLVPLLTTLLQEGALASETETQSLTCVHEENGAKIALYFCSDYLIRAESSQESPPLAEIFYAKRLLERGQHEKIADLEKSKPYFSVGKYVIEQGWISQSDVAQTLITLIEIFAYEVLQWKQVHFQLKPAEPLPPKKISHIPDREFIPVTYFVADAEKNLPVLVLMQQELADFRWTLRRLKEAQRGELSSQQAHVYRYVNHQRTLAKILQISDLGYFETLAATYQLIKWGYLGKGTRGVEPKLTLEMKTEPITEPLVSREARPLSRPSAPVAKPPAVQDQKKSTSKYNITGRHFLKRDRGSELFSVFEALFADDHYSGEVIVENQTDPFRASFVFRDRQLLHATSSEVPVRLGDILLKKKRISASTLKQALQTQRDQSSVLLGQTLVKSGHLNAGELDGLIYHQMAYVLYNVLGWSEVKFYFASHNQGAQKTVQIPIQWQDKPAEKTLFHEAYTALPMLVMLKTKLPQLTQVPVQFSLQNHTLSDTQRAVWMQIDGLTSFQDLLLVSEEGYLETYTALYQMLSTHLIGFKQKGAKKVLPLREAPEPRQWSPVEVAQSDPQPVQSSSPVTPHPLAVLLGEELTALLIALPEHKHAALRQLLYSALEMT
jgi:hypothetical protein